MPLDCQNLPQGKFKQPNIKCDLPQGTGIPAPVGGDMEYENGVLMQYEDLVIMEYET